MKYPFLDYINEDKSQYKTASECGFVDPDNDFLIGDSGGFLLNIIPGARFVNTHLLTEVAGYYLKNKSYCPYPVDSILHRKFRKREEYRRKNGFSAPCLQLADGTIKNIRITGAHYNFINYGMIEQLDESSIKEGSNGASAEKKQAISKFIDAQYWTHKIMEFCENNGFHLIIDKTRRGGFSYIMAYDTANTLNLQPKKTCIHVAYDSKYLTKTGGLTDFMINQLNFYEAYTPFKRGILSLDKENFTLGFKNTNGTPSEKSWNSACFTVSARNNPDCAIGKDARKVKVEELSTVTNFDEFMDVTEPAMRTGAYTTGMLTAWGTATSGNMQLFEQNFYNPRAYNFMHFENVWDDDSRNQVCGYFKPYCWGLQGRYEGKLAMDKDGNSNIEIGLKIASIERENKKNTAKTFSEYINYCGQYANKPSESFSNVSENIFSSEALSSWEERLRTDNSLRFYSDGMLVENDKGEIEFKTNARLLAEGGKMNVNVFDYIVGVPRKSNENPHGCIRKFFNPLKVNVFDPERNINVKTIPKGLYSISYDPVGIDKKKEEITNKHSHNSIKVWENPHPSNGYQSKEVASYYGRPESLEEADRICYKLARYYNCVGTVNVEVNRGETIANFKKWKALKYIKKEPLFVWDTKVKGNDEGNYGYIISEGQKKLDALRLLKEMLYTEVGCDANGNIRYLFHNIYDYQSILELKKWNSVGNFDRVSEMLIRGIEYRAMDIKGKNEAQSTKKATEDNVRKSLFIRNWYN